ncbi:MarR family winged helix-turn-helix transcriptional regulator [Paralimibaculum aggregatum]|nr:winged helix DNA-binding protein [Limibaculum sp. NKW23]
MALAPEYADEAVGDIFAGYLETLALIERLHRLLLDVIKDEFERIARHEVNAVQALLLFNIGAKTMTAGELKNRGYYQGSNVSYNLKKLVEAGYINHSRSEIDRRAVRVRLTERGMEVHRIVADLFRRHAGDLGCDQRLRDGGIEGMNADLRGLERYWTEEIRYIY